MNYYSVNSFCNYHGYYTITELENMLPWEREVYMSLLQQNIEKEQQKTEELMGQYGNNNGI